MCKIESKMTYNEQVRCIDKNSDCKRIFIKSSFAEGYNPLRDNDHKNYN